MITKEKLQKEIDTLTNKALKDRQLNGEVSRVDINRIAELRQLMLYLHTEPNEEYLLKEHDLIVGKMERIDLAYEDWTKTQNMSKLKNPVQTYKYYMGVPELKKKLKTLKFLLEL